MQAPGRGGRVFDGLGAINEVEQQSPPASPPPGERHFLLEIAGPV
jgi:hypothetical protein